MKYKIPFILCVMLLVSATCETQPGGSSVNDAVIIEFLPNMPPTDKLFEEQNFRVGLNIINFEENEKDVEVCVYDSVGDFARGISEKECINLRLKPSYQLQNEIKGSEERVYFPAKDSYYFYDNIEGDFNSIIYSEVTYKHQTIATSSMCVKRDIDVIPQGIKCDLSSSEEVKNNNAPVKISNLKKNVIPAGDNKINLRLEFDVTNVGKGTVIDKNMIGLKRQEDSIIDIGVILRRKSPIALECTGLYNKRLLFRENQKTLICETTIDMKDEFSTEEVKFVLDYGYNMEIFTNSIDIIDKETYK